MSSNYDASEFIDGDYEARKSLYASSPSGPPAPTTRAPSREEVDVRVAEAQQKLSELKRAQEELERERASLEETRRRQLEFTTGRQEMVQHLTRGLTLMEEAELNARREADQTGKTLGELREALAKIQAIKEETWTKDNFHVELTKGLTTLENARMEWNSARLKFPVLSNPPPTCQSSEAADAANRPGTLAGYSFGDLCRLGFAFTWPLAVSVLLAGAALIAVLLRK